MGHDELIRAIRAGKKEREQAIQRLYHNNNLQAGVRKVVSYGKGSDYQFRMILNASLVEFLKKVISDHDFSFSSSPVGYIVGISKNLWLQELRKRSKSEYAIPEGLNVEDDATPIDMLLMNAEVKKSLHKILGLLGKNCKEVLIMWASGYKMTEIATELNYSGDGVARKKKFNCMKELLDYMVKHPDIKKSLL